MSQSDVARFRAQQEAEAAAARQGLSGLAATASHESITARMQQGAETLVRLFEAGQDEEAYRLWDAGILGKERKPV
jgi:hypothetical protein